MSTLQVESGATRECDGSGLNEQHAWSFDAAAGNAYSFQAITFGCKGLFLRDHDNQNSKLHAKCHKNNTTQQTHFIVLPQ